MSDTADIVLGLTVIGVIVVGVIYAGNKVASAASGAIAGLTGPGSDYAVASTAVSETADAGFWTIFGGPIGKAIHDTILPLFNGSADSSTTAPSGDSATGEDASAGFGP